MSARDDIIAGKFKDSLEWKVALHAAGGTGGGATATLFANFVGYASASWDYAAKGNTAKDILTGDGRKFVACGTLREMLMLLFREELNLTVSPQQESHFLCKPSLRCFDSKVKGNVGDHGKPTFDVATRFNEHYFCETGGRFYDPCLMAVYQSKEGPVGQRLKPINGGAGELYKAGTGKALVILHLLRNRPVPGFDSVWEILLPAECKKVLDQRNLQAVKDDLDVKVSGLI